MVERRVIAIEGIVQGVGFRPFVHRLATAMNLHGFVRNDASGVLIDIEGEDGMVDDFIRTLSAGPPFPASIARIRHWPAPLRSYTRFSIAEGSGLLDVDVPVAADVATCDECLAEIRDPASRRHRYPFVDCARCGPRFTIVRDLPYERPRTTMAGFEPCEDCRREYEDPEDRRFQAEAIACPRCGPTLALREAARWAEPAATGDAALAGACAALRAGSVVAVKGPGGYHLACDALAAEAVRRLRERKGQEAGPLPIMVADIDEARRLCHVSDAEAELLASPQRPIVLLARREAEGEDARRAFDELAPGVATLGVMLPFSALHHLLLADFGRPLVMTSGNRGAEPTAFDDGDARERLGAIADTFLTHDQPIAARCDDSVVRSTVVRGVVGQQARRPLFVRRSRGFAPHPIALPAASPEPVLAVGGHRKNTFCLVRGCAAFVSHHVGDLAHPSAHDALRQGIALYERLFGIEPGVIAHDLHPDDLAARLAEDLPARRRIAVQHHHAHIAACLAEHGVDGPAIGIAFDGGGPGTDGAVWGGEFLLVDGASFVRLGRLAYVALPGGDAAAREPWRPAAAHLWAAFEGDLARAPQSWLARQEPAKLEAMRGVLERGMARRTSSAGRLFDAVASLIGLRDVARFEAQAAMELEAIADPHTPRSYPVAVTELGGLWRYECGPLIRAVAEDVAAGRPPAEIAGAFHNAMRDIILAGAARARAQTGAARVALSGGVFQNVRLLELVLDALLRRGFEPLVHAAVPPNDGGLALGQAWVAACGLRE